MEIDAVKRLVGLNIERLMRMQGLDEAGLAERIKKSPDTVERLISGETRVNVEHLALLSDALHVPPESFFQGTGSALEDGYRAAIRRMEDFLAEMSASMDRTDGPVVENIQPLPTARDEASGDAD